MDGYTRSDHYPYSQPLADGTNYMRDSVKVTVDALTGDMRFYANGDDPIRDAWAKLFPTVITPRDKMPASVAKHLRAPEKLFSAQASIFRSFHMTDVNVFYNKEDQWEIAKDSSGKKIKPAYLMLGQPGAKSKGMFLLQPYSLPNKDNLVAWIAEGCDPGTYGQRTVYLLPKERVTMGAAQVSARINQDPKVSQQLTLWTQPGSTLSFGTMIVLPVQNTVAYVQPIFLQAQQSPINQLAGVVAVNGEVIAMDRTLDGALSKAWGGGSDGATVDGIAGDCGADRRAPRTA